MAELEDHALRRVLPLFGDNRAVALRELDKVAVTFSGSCEQMPEANLRPVCGPFNEETGRYATRCGKNVLILNTHKLTETEIANTCGKCTKALRNRLNDDVEAKRQKTGNKEDESRLVELDQMAVTALRNENTKKSCPSVLTDTHLGWFRHPPKRPRSHQ